MSERTEVVEVTRSKTGVGAAAGAITDRIAHVTIAIPSGKGGILTAVSISQLYTMESVMCSGGIVRLRNSSADWDPCWFPIGTSTCVTAGGDALKPFVFELRKKLPGNSEVYVDFTPYDDQSQYLEVTLHWIMTERNPELETFVDVVHPLKADGAAVETGTTTRMQIVTSYAHNVADVIPIPGHKGGTLVAVILQPFGELTTAEVGGGLVEYFVDSHDVTPMEFYTHMMSALGAAGASCYNPLIIPHSHEVKANSNYSAWLTPRATQDQTVTFGIIWERPYDTKR